MDKNITAKWARETSQEILGKKVAAQLEGCEEAIKKAVSENKMSTQVTIYAEKMVLQELRSRGFSVTQTSEQREGDWIVIHWQ